MSERKECFAHPNLLVALWVTNVNQNEHILKEIFCFTFIEIFCSGLYRAFHNVLRDYTGISHE